MCDLFFLFQTHLIMKTNAKERVFVVTLKMKGRNNEQIRNQFENKFHEKGPTEKAIRELLMKFQRAGSVLDDSRSGHPRKSRERSDLVKDAFEQEPWLPIRRANNLLEIPYLSIGRIQRNELRKKHMTFKFITA